MSERMRLVLETFATVMVPIMLTNISIGISQGTSPLADMTLA